MPAMQNTKSVGKVTNIVWRICEMSDVIDITFIISWAVIPPITACIGEISPSAVYENLRIRFSSKSTGLEFWEFNSLTILKNSSASSYIYNQKNHKSKYFVEKNYIYSTYVVNWIMFNINYKIFRTKEQKPNNNLTNFSLYLNICYNVRLILKNAKQ